MNIIKSVQIVLQSSMALGLQSAGLAQVNLVNLYDWTPQTQYGFSPNQGISIDSFNSASFYGQYSVNGRGNRNDIIHPILTASLDTVPGDTYEISYTLKMSNFSNFYTPGSVSFGNDINLFSFSFPQSQPRGDQIYGFDYTEIATPTTTAMTFYVGFIDTADALYLSDFSVTTVSEMVPVPEVSTAGLLGLGGCVWLLAPLCRRSFGRNKQN